MVNDLRAIVQAAGFVPEQVIEEIHRLGLAAGYERIRLDKGMHGGRGGPWYIAGYGCFEVKLRTSDAGEWVTHRPLDDFDRAIIERMLSDNLGRSVLDSPDPHPDDTCPGCGVPLSPGQQACSMCYFEEEVTP